MDGNLSNIINTVLSNPDILEKAIKLMPVITQMMSADKPVQTTAAPADAVPVMAQPVQPPPPAEPPPQVQYSAPAAPNDDAAMRSILSLLSSVKGGTAESAPQTGDMSAQQPMTQSAAVPPQTAAPQAAPPKESDLERTLKTLSGTTSATSPEKDPRIKLLLALRPFMKDGRQDKIDLAVKYLNAAKVFTMIGKNGFV